jgi:hypothetical protein
MPRFSRVACVVAVVVLLALIVWSRQNGVTDFLTGAARAFEAVQVRARADAILRPLSNAKLERGENPMVTSETPILDKGVASFVTRTAKGKFVAISVETSETWDGIATKAPQGAAPRVQGHGRLSLGAYENLPGTLAGTPFMPPPGCYCGETYLSVPGIPAKVVVKTVTSDRTANQRLVGMMVEELAKVGITAVAPKIR